MIPVEPVVLPPVLFVARDPWVQSAPGFPCALYLWRDEVDAQPGRLVPRDRENTSANDNVVIARLDRASQYSRGDNDRTGKPRRTGSRAFAGDDGRGIVDRPA